VLHTPATAAVAEPERGTLVSVPAPVEGGVYIGNTPPVPVYVTATAVGIVVEVEVMPVSEVGKMPVIAVGVIADKAVFVNGVEVPPEEN